MAEPKNQPPATPVSAATRPPPDSTDAQKDAALETIRKSRAQMPGAKEYDPNAKEQTVSVMVNNGSHGGFRAIGRHFPNGLTTGVKVTDDELEELKREPPEILRVVDAAEVARLAGKESSASSAPDLADDEKKALEAYRAAKAAGNGDAFLTQAQKLGAAGSSSDSSSGSSSTGSAGDAGSKRGK